MDQVRDKLRIGGAEYSVACNMNALMGFLEDRGTDDFGALTDLTKLKPTDMLPLIAACVREGERIEGRQCSLSAKDIGEVADFRALTDFMEIFGRSMAPAVTVEKK
jgi:hypothetical protein